VVADETLTGQAADAFDAINVVKGVRFVHEPKLLGEPAQPRARLARLEKRDARGARGRWRIGRDLRRLSIPRKRFEEPALISGLTHTLIYAVVTCGSKVVLGMALAVLLTGPIIGRGFMRSVAFFPVLVSVVGVGLTFKALMDPTDGVINQALGAVGISGPAWLVNPDLALYSVALVDVWQGVGLATVIFMAGILSIPHEYYEAAKVDGAGAWQRFRNITLPLAKPATVSVVILSLIGGLRTFDLIWTMTKGGPGFTSDVMSSVIYKQYQAGFYGLSTAGNVMLFLLVVVIVGPLYWIINRKDLDK